MNVKKNIRLLNKENLKRNYINAEGHFFKGVIYGSILSLILWMSFFGWIKIIILYFC